MKLFLRNFSLLLLLSGLFQVSSAQSVLHGNGTFSLCSGTYFDSGDSTANYADNENSVLTLCSDIGDCIRLDFTSFSLENGFDFLTIYDGASTSSPLIGSYTGLAGPGVVTSTTGCLTILFQSDASITAAGWEATISCLACNYGPCLPNMANCIDSVCTGNFHDTGGNANNYLNNLILLHTICSDAGSCVEVNFSSFDLENGFDFLSIYDGPDNSAPLIGTYTGTNSPGQVFSSSGCLSFLFQSDGSVTAAGWDASISCVNCICLPAMANCVDSLCTGDFYDSGRNTGNYANGDSLVHTICSDNGNCVQVDFSSFDIENGFDFLFIYDGPSTASSMIGSYTGTTTPGTVTSSTGCLTFEFIADTSVTGPGWEAAISCLSCTGGPVACLPNMGDCRDTVCTGNFFDSGGNALNYGDNESLNHTICSNAGNCIKVDFTSFDIEANWDFLTIYDGPNNTFPAIGTFTGTNTPGTVVSTSGCLTFSFTSDASITKPGWTANISCVTCPCLPNMTTCTDSICSGNFFDSGGNSLNYFDNENLVHTLCSDIGNCMQVDFSAFQLENGFDTLWIYDGPTTGATLIGSYTDTVSPGTVSSSTGCLTFEFNSDASVTAPGWEASLSCVPCAGCPLPTANYTYTSNQLNASFTNTSTTSGSTTYFWDFGDGNNSSQQNPSHIYPSPGNYTACLIVNDSCASDTSCQTIAIACPAPNANFSWLASLGTITFTDISTGTGIFSWDWDYGDGNAASGQNTVHTYASPGTYQVCLTIRDQCGSDSTCYSVNVNCPLPSPGFSSSNSFLTTNFTDLSTGNSVFAWFWTFGDGNASSLQNPSHTYFVQGNYTVCLLVTDSCGTDSICQSVLITCPPPVAGFTVTTNLLSANFSDVSTGTNVSSWSWDFGDGNNSSAQNPAHTYASAGTYTVCLVITDTCGMDTSCQNILVNCPDPNADFNVSSNGLVAAFTDQTAGTNVSSWNWDFGDGNSSTLQNPSHTYGAGGTYTVCLTAADTCGTDTVCKLVLINCPNPIAAYNSSVNGLNAVFSDLSAGNVYSWNWSFGDGNNSSAQNPAHTYAGPGTYIVCLTVTDSCGTDSVCAPMTIAVSGCNGPQASFSSNLSGTSATFTDFSTSSFILQSWNWDFGDGNNSSLQNPVHNYAGPGTYVVCLSVADSCGTDTLCTSITITGACPIPVSAFSSSVNGLNISLLDQSSSQNTILSWDWIFGDGNTSNLQNPSHTYANPGTYQICLSVQDSCGSNQSCQTVTVVCPAPIAVFAANGSNLAYNFIDFSNGTGISSWNWTFGDGSSSSLQNPAHSYAGPGTYNVCLNIQDSCGMDTLCQSIVVTCAAPGAAFTFSSNGLDASFTDQSGSSIGILSWNWDFGDGNSSAQQNPMHTFGIPGSYIVCLAIEDTCGRDTVCLTVQVDTLVGLFGESWGGIEVYPNPHQGLFFVDFDLPDVQILKIRMLNIYGQIVRTWVTDPVQKSKISFEMTDLTAGHYILEIQVGEQFYRKRIEYFRF